MDGWRGSLGAQRVKVREMEKRRKEVGEKIKKAGRKKGGINWKKKKCNDGMKEG